MLPFSFLNLQHAAFLFWIYNMLRFSSLNLQHGPLLFLTFTTWSAFLFWIHNKSYFNFTWWRHKYLFIAFHRRDKNELWLHWTPDLIKGKSLQRGWLGSEQRNKCMVRLPSTPPPPSFILTSSKHQVENIVEEKNKSFSVPSTLKTCSQFK